LHSLLGHEVVLLDKLACVRIDVAYGHIEAGLVSVGTCVAQIAAIHQSGLLLYLRSHKLPRKVRTCGIVIAAKIGIKLGSFRKDLRAKNAVVLSQVVAVG